METYFNNLTEATPEKLLADLNVLEINTRELFRTDENRVASHTRDKFLDGLERVKATCRRLQEQTEQEEFSSHQFPSVHRFPYATMGIVFGLGMIAGILAQRRPR